MLDDVHQGDVIKVKFVINGVKTFLWKVEGLVNQVRVFYFHLLSKMLRFVFKPNELLSQIPCKVNESDLNYSNNRTGLVLIFVKWTIKFILN